MKQESMTIESSPDPFKIKTVSDWFVACLAERREIFAGIMA